MIWGNVSFPPLILNTKPDPNETLTVRVQTEPLPVETVQNLKSQTPYRFASRAWNWFKGAQHAGDWSDWSEEIQLCGEVPEKVSSFLTKTREAGNFNLEWEEPSDNGLDINRYIVNYCKCTNVDRDNSDSGEDPCSKCKQILGGAGKEKKCYNAVEIDEAGLQDSIKSKTKSMEEGTLNQLDISEPDNLIPAYYYAMIICACNRQGCGLPSRVLNDKVQETGLKMGKVTLEDSNDISIVTLITNENTTTAYYVSLDVDAHSKNTTVIVNIASDNENCQIEPTSVTFSQTTDGSRIPDAYKIEVEVGGNLIDEGDGKPFADCKITHTIDSNDIYYISSQPSYLEVRVNNDDIADTKLRPAEAYDDEEVVKFEPFYLKFLGPITVAEGVSQVYGIQLESEPIQPVYINIGVTKPRPATPTEVILSTSKLAFNRSNWNEIQIVEIFVMDDDVDSKMDVEDFYLNHVTESLDPVYAAKALNMTVVVRVEDDDEAGVTFDSEDVIEVSEGETGVSFQIMKLKTRPLDDVTLMLTSSQPLLQITPDSIVVSVNEALDLNASVTVKALNGDYNEKTSAIISVTSTSNDEKYDSQVKFSRTVAISTSIGDTIGKVVLKNKADDEIVINTMITKEKEHAAYNIELDTNMKSLNSTVTVNIVSNNKHCKVSPTSVIFSQTDALTMEPIAHTIEVQVGGNDIDEGDDELFALCKITHTRTSTDEFYTSNPSSVLEIRVNNDDVAGTKLRPAAAYEIGKVVTFEDFFLTFLGPISVKESVSQVYGIQLESEPIQPVYINIGVTKPRPATPTEVILSTSKLAFNRSNWNEIQIVEIFVMDDDVDSKMDVEDFYLNHVTESLDPVYAAKALNMTVVVRVEDDDEAGVTFDSEDVIEVSEGETGVSFQIMKLKTRPLDDVTLMLTSSQPLLQITPDSIFVSINNALDLNASVTVEALEGNYRGKTSAIISVTSTSNDPKYDSQVKFSRTVAINTKKFTTASDCNDDFFLNITDLNPRYHYCQPCPQGASCRGPVVFKQVVSLFGWSRCPNDRTKFERCNFPAACLGASNPTFYGKFKGDPAKNNTKEACHYAYVNNSLLCGACNSEFSHSDLSGKCSTCPKLWRNILLGFLGVLAGVVLIVLYIIMTLSAHGSIDADDSLLPIGLSYVQVISLLVTFPIAWPQIFVSIFQVGGAVTVLGQHMVNLKCMTDTQTDASVFYAQRVVWVIMPPFILGVNSMTWMILYRKCTSFQLKNKTIQHKNKLNAIKGSNVALLYLLWPSLCSQTFALFSCQGICNSQVLRAE